MTLIKDILNFQDFTYNHTERMMVGWVVTQKMWEEVQRGRYVICEKKKTSNDYMQFFNGLDPVNFEMN